MANTRASTESAVANRIGRARHGDAAGSPAAGFTVVELLVVLAVVVILATLLAPAYNGARVESIATSCGSNLHHIGVGFGAFRAQHPVRDAGDTRGSGPFPPALTWPGIPGTMIADWNLFICPAETKLSTSNSVLEFHSQEGWSVPFGPSDCCQVHVGPGSAWGGDANCPPTPAGATDYGFEDVGGPGSTYKGDADFNDAVIRIYDGADEAFLIAGSAAYSNSIWSNGKLLYQIPSIWGRVDPPVKFQLPAGKTNYGYNGAVAGVAADATIVALDYPFATIDPSSDDVHGTIGLHPELGLRHQNKVNVLKADGSVWRARISEVDPTTADIKKLWGIK